MKAEPLQLPDGRTLQERRGSWILQPDGITVTVERAGELVRVADPDSGRVIVEAEPVAPGPAAKPAGGKPAATPAAPGRWQTFNQFVDVIGPELTLAEREVWHVMFRHARGGVVETTARRLATACRIDKATVVRAQRRLEAAGLIRTRWKSIDKARPSKYALDPSPAACLPKLLSRRSPK
jgi:hypothetical protein